MKTKMKWMRLVALTLALLMSVAILAACENDKNDEKESADSQNITDTVEVPTETEPATEPVTEAETEAEPTLDIAKLLGQALAADTGATWDLSKNIAIKTTGVVSTKMSMAGNMNFDMTLPIEVTVVMADGAMSMATTVQIGEEKGTQTTIWKDGTLYCDEYGQKVKCQIDWDKAQTVVGSTPVDMPMLPTVGEGLSVTDLFISLSANQAEDGSITVTAKGLNTKAYSQLLSNSDFINWMVEMGAVNPSYDEEGNMLDVPEEALRAALSQLTEENMIITYTLDKEGNLTSQSCKMKVTTSGEDGLTGSYTSTIDFDLTTAYTYGGQTVTAPSSDDASWTEVTFEEIIGIGDDTVLE